LPIKPAGAGINRSSTAIRTSAADEIYYAAIIANLILTAVKLRLKISKTR